MTMTVDTSSQHRFGHSNFDPMSSYSSHPQFTNPWNPSTSHDGLPHLNLSSIPKHPQSAARTSSTASMPPYASLPVSSAAPPSAPISDVYSRQDLLPMPQDVLSISRLQQHPATTTAAYDTTAYTTSASPVTTSYATPATPPPPYDSLAYAPAPMTRAFAPIAPEESVRRYSQQSVASNFMDRNGYVDDYDRRGLQPDDRKSFQDALEASHGMLSMSQDTPRNIYDVRARQRGSADSYGFPTHSTNSSVSSTGFSGYYGGSVDGSVSDYSSATSDIESVPGRAHPRARGGITQGGITQPVMIAHPPAPQSMMGSFNSKAGHGNTKRHKCKVCDKRFTRPSSLQTHMYSHTGEKPYRCEVEGCGRHFSVVSNLRRHSKVHRHQHSTDATSETGSEDY
ncbi:C2H2 zinc finger protein encoded by the fle1 protein [Podospora fimiseda]|uniref:C2H2 zinc finger protein encoded by the fle1 protein n=1 Tax=Podospora fimiseda TaxID=252190 RepID=A0AAN7BXX8_9PEZI|nr:C2H2 zinc finger protein encoded by the fle1 protein [Podospora fimiseda]